MKKIVKAIIIPKSKVNNKTLENYGKNICNHDYFELFPSNEYDFTNSQYSEYLYLGKMESKAFLQDYLTLISNVYNTNIFSLNHYYSVVAEFIKYLEHHNIYFMYRTYFGHKIVNENPTMLIDEFNLLGNNVTIKVIDNTNKICEINGFNNAKYNYVFFEFIAEKISNTIEDSNYLLEPITNDDISQIKNVYNNSLPPKNPPFFLNVNGKYYKYNHQLVEEYVICLQPQQNGWLIYDKINKKIVGFFIVTINNKSATLNTICDGEYMDSNFYMAIKTISDSLLAKGINNIVGLNFNENIAYSGTATAYGLAHFKPDYSSIEQDNSYTRLKFLFSRDDTAHYQSTNPSNSLSSFYIIANDY